MGSNVRAIHYADWFSAGHVFCGRHVCSLSSHSGSAYSSAGSRQTNSSSSSNIYFPKAEGVTFEQANATQITAKLRELNSSAPGEVRLGEEVLISLERLLQVVSDTTQQTQPSDDQIGAETTHWPEDIVFPVLDILRLAVRHPEVNSRLCSGTEGVTVCNHLLSLMTPGGRTANQMLALRTLCNCFSGAAGRALLLAQREAVLSHASDLRKVSNKNVHVALATLVLNYAGLLLGRPAGSELEGKAQSVSVASAALECVTDREAVFRLLVALGTTVTGDGTAKDLARSLGVASQIHKYAGVTEPAKVGECCRLLLNELE